MNTLGYQITNDSVDAYQSWMLPELQSAMGAEPIHRTVRPILSRGPNFSATRFSVRG